MGEIKEYKIGDTYWYVNYGVGGKLKVYSIKICSDQDFGKGIAQFDSWKEADKYLKKHNEWSPKKKDIEMWQMAIKESKMPLMTEEQKEEFEFYKRHFLKPDDMLSADKIKQLVKKNHENT